MSEYKNHRDARITVSEIIGNFPFDVYRYEELIGVVTKFYILRESNKKLLSDFLEMKQRYEELMSENEVLRSTIDGLTTSKTRKL